MSVSAIGTRHRKARPTVLKAIRVGRLPAEAVEVAGGRKIWLIDPADADALWGQEIKLSA